ncbi:MAG: hypothetical protein E6I84_10965 [Chloroflexi bacterium]|nr:MAG: hypothetical protein E6I84_10965 [Chloroflexota bacterium]
MQARLLNTAAEKTEADALIVPIVEGQTSVPAEAQALDKKLKGAIEQLLKDREFRGKFMELVPVHNLNNAASKWTVLVGVGKLDQLDMVRLRNALQAAGRVLRKRGHRRVAIVLPKEVAARASAADLARAATEGIGLSNFDVGSLKTRHDHAVTQIDSLSLIGLNGDRNATQALKDAVALTDATNRIREWVNAPANAFTPAVFADKVKESVKGTALDLKVLDVDDMRRLKMGALLAVARGSDEPAKMIVLRYSGGRKNGPNLALVGKGITFDSGGISIKPAQNMEMMKSDMGGGAAVVGAMLAIAELKPKINVIGIVPTDQARRCGDGLWRQDDRDHQHRCRGPADPVGWDHLRRQRGRDPHRRHRHPDRIDHAHARPARHRGLRKRPGVDGSGAPGRRSRRRAYLGASHLGRLRRADRE